MARTVSTTLRTAFNAQESNQIVVVLLTITHPDLASPIYLSSDPTTAISTVPVVYGTTSRSNIYTFVPMSVTLPDDKDDSPPQAKLALSNVSREMIVAVRSVESPASIKIELVRAAAPNTVEIAYPPVDLISADADASTITLTLSSDSMLAEPYPADTIAPASFPSVFAI